MRPTLLNTFPATTLYSVNNKSVHPHSLPIPLNLPAPTVRTFDVEAGTALARELSPKYPVKRCSTPKCQDDLAAWHRPQTRAQHFGISMIDLMLLTLQAGGGGRGFPERRAQGCARAATRTYSCGPENPCHLRQPANQTKIKKKSAKRSVAPTQSGGYDSRPAFRGPLRLRHTAQRV